MGEGERASAESFGILIGKSATLLSELNSNWIGFSESQAKLFIVRFGVCAVAHLSLVCARLTADHTCSLMFLLLFLLFHSRKKGRTTRAREKSNRLASLFGDKVLHAFHRNINKNQKLFLIESKCSLSLVCSVHVCIMIIILYGCVANACIVDTK